jgi:uncharacterized protein (DUF2267 family)
MSRTGLDVFDTTLHKTNAWLSELMQGAHLADRHAAYRALRATLHALRDRLTWRRSRSSAPSSRS